MKSRIRLDRFLLASAALAACSWIPAAVAEPHVVDAAKYKNGLGMKFVKIPGTEVLFCVWDTRIQDYAAFATATNRFWVLPAAEQAPAEPVVNVSWGDAAAFCDWLTQKERREGKIGRREKYRLPTDAEWSAASGLGTEDGKAPKDKDRQIPGVYPWGTQWPPPHRAGNYADSSLHKAEPIWPQIPGYEDGYPHASPVGRFRANRFGLYDMGGNVWQWCDDFYAIDDSDRVLRGGSWLTVDPADALLSARLKFSPDTLCGQAGFRCVLASLSEAQATIYAHALAFGAIIEVVAGDPLTDLKSKRSPDEERKLLLDLWRIQSRPQLLYILRSLEIGTTGQRAPFWTSQHSSGERDVESSGEVDLAAWDFGRYINLCRWGCNAQYLSETEAWDRILPVARLLQRSYRSWDDFSADFLHGLEVGAPEEMKRAGGNYRVIVADLLDGPDGLWANTPWDQSLGEGPVAVDRFAMMAHRHHSQGLQKDSADGAF